jgi:PKD repeat protein
MKIKIYIFFILFFIISIANLMTEDTEGKIRVLTKYPFTGSEVSFEVEGARIRNFLWDFGDGKTLMGGRKVSHVYIRSGPFTIKVFDPENKRETLAQLRFTVLREDRSIILQKDTVNVGEQVDIIGVNFIDKYIKWNFGDGTPITRGGNRISHNYDRAGTYKIKAVDLDGKDAKKIIKKIRVIEAIIDNRSVEGPDSVIEGEVAGFSIKNARGGDYIWEFSDGNTGTGLSVNAIIFKRPGLVTVTVKDRSGKLPSLTKNIRILSDRRKIEAKKTFALPDDEILFNALNFSGNRVKWIFGDGSVKENASTSIRYKFSKPGKYLVTAIDNNGESAKKFSQEVIIGDLTPDFQVTHLEMTFDDGKYYKVVPRKSLPPSYQVKIKAKGRGQIRGRWILNGTVMGLFEEFLQENRTALLEDTETVKLPLINLGLNVFTFIFTDYRSPVQIPKIKYFVSEIGRIETEFPSIGEKVSFQPHIDLRWYLKKWRGGKSEQAPKSENYRYEITISKKPFQFLSEEQIRWRKAGKKNHYKLKLSSHKDSWVYWQIRYKSKSGIVLTTSEIFSFRVMAK